MKTRTIVSASLLSLLFCTTVAVAGLTQPAPVDVDLVNMSASGDQVTARYSRNDVEYIGCGIRKFDDGAGSAISFGFCQAQDEDEEQFTCFTQNADLLDAISSSGEFGFITFAWDANDECTQIGFSNQSFYLPEKLKSNE